MSIFLVGSGPDDAAFPDVFDRFAAEAAERAGGGPARVAVAVHSPDGRPVDRLPDYARPLAARLGCTIIPALLADGQPADPATFGNVHGILVGGGLTPSYLQGLSGAGPAIARAVAGGVPYVGFSAGAMVAPGRALIGGYRVNGAEVCGEECTEGLDELVVRPGLDLVPFAVDVHAAQAGTLSRAIGAVAAGLVDRALAIDEGTAAVLPAPNAGHYTVIGADRCWDIRAQPGQAVIPAGGTAARPVDVALRTAAGP
jgi:cyanophycinase